jgi:hypothetical protein
MAFCENQSLMVVAKGKRVNKYAAYYFIKLCDQHHEMDRVLTTFMNENLKASSNSGMGIDEEDTEGDSGGKGTKKGKELRAAINSLLKPTTEQMNANHKEAQEQRERLMTMQEGYNKMQAESSKWNELTAAGEKLSELVEKYQVAVGTQQSILNRLIGTLNKRIVQLEEELGIGKEESLAVNLDDLDV